MAAVSPTKSGKSWSHKKVGSRVHTRKGSQNNEGSWDHFNNEKAAVSYKRDRSRDHHKNESADEYVGTQNRPQPFSQKIRQPWSRKRAAVSPTKEKEAVRTQKKDSREYHKREGSREKAVVIDTKEREPWSKRGGSLGNTKQSSLLSPPQTRIWSHDYRK